MVGSGFFREKLEGVRQVEEEGGIRRRILRRGGRGLS
jgi:hypothetical protein